MPTFLHLPDASIDPQLFSLGFTAFFHFLTKVVAAKPSFHLVE